MNITVRAKTLPKTPAATLPQITDHMGNTLSAGDKVAYPVRKGSRMWLETATISDISFGVNSQGRPLFKASITKGNGRISSLQNFGRCIKLPA